MGRSFMKLQRDVRSWRGTPHEIPGISCSCRRAPQKKTPRGRGVCREFIKEMNVFVMREI